MQDFKMLYSEQSVLQAADELRFRDVREAIEKASSKPAHQRLEMWQGGRRVAEVGASPGQQL